MDTHDEGRLVSAWYTEGGARLLGKVNAHLQLVESVHGIRVVAIDPETLEPFPDGNLLLFTLEGRVLFYSGVNETLGFPLTSEGRLETV